MTNQPISAPDFLARFAPCDLATKVSALKTADSIGLGIWARPEAATDNARPATHVHEITLFDIYATGATETNLAANWFRAAGRLVSPEVAA